MNEGRAYRVYGDDKGDAIPPEALLNPWTESWTPDKVDCTKCGSPMASQLNMDRCTKCGTYKKGEFEIKMALTPAILHPPSCERYREGVIEFIGDCGHKDTKRKNSPRRLCSKCQKKLYKKPPGYPHFAQLKRAKTCSVCNRTIHAGQGHWFRTIDGILKRWCKDCHKKTKGVKDA
jgi:hypothetical protein